MQSIESIIRCTKEKMNRFANLLTAAAAEGSAAVICSDAALRQTAIDSALPPLTVLPPV